MLSTEPPPGITCWQNEDHIDDLRARKYDQRASDCVQPLCELKYLTYQVSQRKNNLNTYR